MMRHDPFGLVYDVKTHSYVDRKSGEVVPAERLDEYARGRLEKAIERLARAFVSAKLRFRGEHD